VLSPAPVRGSGKSTIPQKLNPHHQLRACVCAQVNKMNRNKVLLAAQHEIHRLNDEAFQYLAEASEFGVSKTKKANAQKRHNKAKAELAEFAAELVQNSAIFLIEPLTEELQRFVVTSLFYSRTRNAGAA
jgi:hypothetical protein